MKKFLIPVIGGILILGTLAMPHAFAQTDSVPAWFKGVAGFWAQGDITNSEFIDGIEYLIDKKVIRISNYVPVDSQNNKESTVSEDSVPAWFKGVAGFWAQGDITNSEFIDGIKYLIEKKVITSPNYRLVDSQTTLEENLSIGLLFSETGDYSTYGHENHLAAMAAINDFNEHLKSIDKEMELIPVVTNLSSDPITTLEQVKKLHIDGVDVFIGPDTSAELAVIKPYVDSNEILVISTSSTAPSLAVADSIYRLVPDDTHQAKIISNLLEDDDIETVFLLVRDDIWGIELANAFKKSFTNKVLQVIYNPEDTLYEKKLQELSDLIESEPTKYNTAIVVIGFGETADFMLHAISYDNLDDVKWYGTDSNANEIRIIEDDQTAAFAQRVSFKAIQFASDITNPVHVDVETRLYLDLKYLPGTYAYATYDAVWLTGLSMLEANSTEPGAIESEIRSVAKSYNGALGEIHLNDAGDLVSDNYDIWFVEDGKWYKELR